jgi:hypothetical protein
MRRAAPVRPRERRPKIEDGLDRSRVLVLCMSANSFGSDWNKLESQTFRFRDPLNKDRRFIPLRLDDTAPKGSLAQFSYVDWRKAGDETQYARLLQGCRIARREGSYRSSHWCSHPTLGEVHRAQSNRGDNSLVGSQPERQQGLNGRRRRQSTPVGSEKRRTNFLLQGSYHACRQRGHQPKWEAWSLWQR